MQIFWSLLEILILIYKFNVTRLTLIVNIALTLIQNIIKIFFIINFPISYDVISLNLKHFCKF